MKVGDILVITNTTEDQHGVDNWIGREVKVLSLPNYQGNAYVEMFGERPDGNGSTPFFWPAKGLGRVGPTDEEVQAAIASILKAT